VIGLERTLADINIHPPRGNREDFIVQPGGPIAIQRQASEQDHAGDGVVGHANAGAREVVMHEALTLESGQQALHEPMLEMQMHGRRIE